MTQLERALLSLCLVEAVALVLVIGGIFYLYRRHELIVRQLLDRILALPAGAAGLPTLSQEPRPLRNRSMPSDEELAARERARKEAAARG